MRQESTAGLRGWDLVQGPAERSALGPWGWTGRGDWRSGGLVGGWDKGPGNKARAGVRALGMERREGVRDRAGDWPWGGERGGAKRKLLANESFSKYNQAPTTCQEFNMYSVILS